MVKRKRRSFNQKFKVDAVKRTLEFGANLNSIAKNLGIHPVMLSRWKNNLMGRSGIIHEDKPIVRDIEEEMRCLQREVVSLKKERDFLKRTVGHFLAVKNETEEE